MEYAVAQASVMTACDGQRIVGSDLRALLAREIPAKILLRQGRDVVLLTGATGTGKERVAATVHEAARACLGRKGDLVEVNCANLTGSLFESELFGYRKGAFTGAERDVGGLVARATQGTLVLDEIQSLEPQNQARLLRLLGEREYRSVGDEQLRKTDALILLSTNRDLRQMVTSGGFRRDLLDRAGAKIHLPSLCERRRDIGELAQSFALEAGAELGASRPFFGLTRRARADLETAVVKSREVSVRRLREIVRNIVFMAAADTLPEAIESDLLAPILQNELAFSLDDRDAEDVRELTSEFDVLVGLTELDAVAARHAVSPRSLAGMCRALSAILTEMPDSERSYRSLVERISRLSKIAMWLVSGAQTQADFRRFFGSAEADMPTKSVAHQVYHQVFDATGKPPGGST
jgi:transcriptional regulator with AAA-type ATPase domain